MSSWRLVNLLCGVTLVVMGSGCRVVSGGEAGVGLLDSGSGERSVIRSAGVEVAVDDVKLAEHGVEAIVVEVDGYVENTRSDSDKRAQMVVRVPSVKLDQVVERVAALGEETGRWATAMDVTDGVIDLEATLRNKRALRDRLRELLEETTNIDEVLRLEQALSRVQTEIEAAESRLEQLRKQVKMATLSVALERPRVLGPLGWVWWGLSWSVTKLFVIRE